MRDDSTPARAGRLRAALATIVTLEDRTHDPDRPAVRSGPAGRPGSRPPLPIGAVSTREDALACLTSWARVVVEERDLRTRLVADTAGHVAAWLRPHADWLAAHQAGRDAADEIEHHAAAYAALAQPTGRRHFAVGRGCPVTGPDGACPGMLLAELQGHDDYDVSAITCSVDPREHRWAPDEWLRLGLLLTVERAS